MKKDAPIFKKLLLALVSVIGISLSHAGVIVPSQSPLFQSSSTEPNVMLLFDTSGSMSAVIEKSRYYEDLYLANTSQATGTWDYCTELKSGACKSSSWKPVANTTLTGVIQANCSNGYLFRKGTTTYCFKLPSGYAALNYEVNYFKWLFDNNASGTDLSAKIKLVDVTRLSMAKKAVKTIVEKPGIRFGLTRFDKDDNDGGYVKNACDSSATNIASIKTNVDSFTANGGTPLAETYYEITRYFRGLEPYYHSSGHGSATIQDGKFVSPMTKACQKNFIVAITDGLPSVDSRFPSDDPDDTASSNNLPNWDGKNTNDTVNNNSIGCFNDGGYTLNINNTVLKAFSDGWGSQTDNANRCPNVHDDSVTNTSREAYNIWLDDLAAFGMDLDVKLDTELDPEKRLYTGKQNLPTFTIGIDFDPQVLKDAATVKTDDSDYFTVSNPSELNVALQDALDEISKSSSSSSAVTTNSTRLDTGTLLFQARFVGGGEWSGELLAYSINTDITSRDYGKINTTPEWSTMNSGKFLAAADRKIFTRINNTGTTFIWSNLDSTLQTLYNKTPGTNTVDNNGNLRVNYLRGDNTYEGDTSLFRLRGINNASETNILGDIINSDPYFQGAIDDYGYKNMIAKIDKDGDGVAEYETGASKYVAFLTDNKVTNLNTLYVGSNDGMMHAFDAASGIERFSYIPSMLLTELPKLTSKTYSHQYFVDGSPNVAHVMFSQNDNNENNDTWKSILIGSLGAGGKGIYALDVTNPGTFSTSNVLWEFVSGALGYIFNTPTTVPLANGQWGTLIPNGIANSSHTAKLYIVDTTSGNTIREFDTGVGDSNNPNGLTSAIGVKSSDGLVTVVYGADLHGNIWRFDLSSRSSSDWDIAYSGRPVFTATDASGNPQKITAAMDIGRNATGGYQITFGTGKYLEATDGSVGSSPQVESFYGIRDTGTGLKTDNTWTTITRSNLIAQTISETSIPADASNPLSGNLKDTDGNDIKKRVVSSNIISDADKGWYIDLLPASGIASGERVVEAPILRAGRVIFVTLIPDSDSCVPGGTSWLMEVNAQTGGLLTYAVLDSNNDGKIDSADIALAGTNFESIVSKPAITGGTGVEKKYLSSSNGSIIVETESAAGTGRMSWRQLR